MSEKQQERKTPVVRLNPEAYRVAEEIAGKTGRSIAQVISDAVFKAYLGVDKALEGALDKKVTDIKTETFRVKSSNLYCSVCKRQINPGELATVVTIYYEDNTQQKLFYCYNCWMEQTINDQQLLRLEKRKYELERAIRVLRQEKKKLLDEIVKHVIHKMYIDLLYKINFILDTFKPAPEYAEKLLEIQDEIRRLDAKVTPLIKPVKPKGEVKIWERGQYREVSYR